jgi:ribosomal-protein-serine acetyltransferase
MTSVADPAPPHAFALRLDADLALRLRERHHVPELATRLEAERAHLAPVFAWARRSAADAAERQIEAGLDAFRRGAGWHADLCHGGEVVGAMWLHEPRQGPGGSTEVGYWLGRAFESRGLVTRAMEGLHRHFFEARGLGRVSVAAVPGNVRSEAIAKRLGYRPEAVLRQAHVDADGRVVDLAFYGLLREDWRGPGPDAPPLPLPRFVLHVDDGLELALYEREDVKPLFDLVMANQAHLSRWMPWAAGASPEAQGAFVERTLSTLAAGEGVDTGIWWRGRLVGAAGLHGWSERPRRCSVGYWIAEDVQGHGIATRVTRALIAKAFEDLGVTRVDLRADVANTRSRAVAERLGLRFEGVLPRELPSLDGYVDMAVYAVLAAEWAAADHGPARHAAG